MRIGEVSTGSLLKLGLVCAGSFWLVVSVIFGLLALFGIYPVFVNRVATFGIEGFLMSLLIGTVFTIVGSIIVTLGGLLSRLIPRLSAIHLTRSDGAGVEIRDVAIDDD